jgi:hypothetical protein
LIEHFAKLSKRQKIEIEFEREKKKIFKSESKAKMSKCPQQYFAWHAYLEDGSDMIVEVEHGLLSGMELKLDGDVVQANATALRSSENVLTHELECGAVLDCIVYSYGVAFRYDLFIDGHSPYSNNYKRGAGEQQSRYPVGSIIAMSVLVVVGFVLGFLFGLFAIVPLLLAVVLASSVSCCISAARRRRLPAEPRFEHAPVARDGTLQDVVLHGGADDGDAGKYFDGGVAPLLSHDIVAGYQGGDNNDAYMPPPPESYAYNQSIVAPPPPPPTQFVNDVDSGKEQLQQDTVAHF